MEMKRVDFVGKYAAGFHKASLCRNFIVLNLRLIIALKINWQRSPL